MIGNILSVLVAAGSIAVGAVYVHATACSSSRNIDQTNKQEYVKQNRNYFGASNKGTSMDGQEIYTVEYSKLGF